MSDQGYKLRGNFLFWVRIGRSDVAVYLDKEYVVGLAQRATVNVKRVAKKGPVMCHAMRGHAAGRPRLVSSGRAWRRV